jgi:ABC-type polysaccharide/polyol phosphate export permease
MICNKTILFYNSFLVGRIHVIDLLVYRVLNGFFQGFIISLIYSLIVLWFFGIHSGSIFMRYWMFNWLASLVFGLIIAIITVNFGILGNFFLTIFVILMLGTATIQITLELSPSFYRCGYGLPLYHILNGSRHLLFNSYSDFGLDVGILLIYFGVLWILTIITSAFWMKRQEKKILKEKQQTKTKTKTNKKGYSVAVIGRN